MHEISILLDLARGETDAARERCGRRRPDPDRFAALAREADIHPWVHARLVETGAVEWIGPEVVERLAVLRKKVTADNLLLLAHLEEVLDLLASRGIVPVLLKGSDTLHRFHRRFDERTLDDADLLLHPSHVGPAVRALAAAGWTVPTGDRWRHWIRSSHHVPVHSAGPVRVDLEIHWSLVQERRYRLDPEEILARAVPLEVAGRRALRLEDHDAVAHLLLHHVSHYFDRRLKWAIDLDHLSANPGFRWEWVAERLRRWGGAQAAGMALRHLHRLHPRAAPAEALAHLPVAGWRRALVAPLRSRHPLELFRGTRRRAVQLMLAAVLLEHPRELPGYLLHRARRDSLPGAGPVERWDGDEPGAGTV